MEKTKRFTILASANVVVAKEIYADHWSDALHKAISHKDGWQMDQEEEILEIAPYAVIDNLSGTVKEF